MKTELLDKAAQSRAEKKIRDAYAAAQTAFRGTFQRLSGRDPCELPGHFRPTYQSLPVQSVCESELRRSDLPAHERLAFQVLLTIYKNQTAMEFDALVADVERLVAILHSGEEGSGQ